MTHRYRVEFSPKAADDLHEIALWIAADSPVNAARFVASLRAAITKLDRFPARSPVAPEGIVDGQVVRHLVVKDYRILFTIEGRQVRVHGVRHSRRLPLGK